MASGSDGHVKKLDPDYNKPKMSAAPKKPTCMEGSLVAPARGDEFLMPLQAFFCSLCCEFSKDNMSAETHIKSREHNNKFKNFLKDNPSYEIQYLRGKMCAATSAAYKEIERQRMTLNQPIQQHVKLEDAAKPETPGNMDPQKMAELPKRKLVEGPPEELDSKRLKFTKVEDKVESKPGTGGSGVGKEVKDSGKQKQVEMSSDSDLKRSKQVVESKLETSKAQTKTSKGSSPDRSRRDRDRSPAKSYKKEGRSRDKSPDSRRRRTEDIFERRSPPHSQSRKDEKRDSSSSSRGDKKQKTQDKKSPLIVIDPSPPKSISVPAAGGRFTSSATTTTTTLAVTFRTGVTSTARSTATTTTGSVHPTGVSPGTLRTLAPVSISTSAPLPRFNFAWAPRAVRQPVIKKPTTAVRPSSTVRTSQPGNTGGASQSVGPFNMQDFEVLDECDES